MKVTILSILIVVLLVVYTCNKPLDLTMLPVHQSVEFTTKQQISDNIEHFMTPSNYSNRMLFSIDSSENYTSEHKQEVSGSFQFGKVLVGLMCNKSMAMITGGSSGNYFYQWLNLGDIIRVTSGIVQCMVNGGITFGDRVMLYYSHGANSVKLADKFHHFIPFFSSLKLEFDDKGDITLGETHKFLNHLNHYKPDALFVFPAVLFRHAQNIYSNKLHIEHQPKFIDVSAEFLFLCQFMFIKTIFPDSDVRMSYGSIECGWVAQQLPFNEWKTDNDMFTYKVLDNKAHIENIGDDKLVITSHMHHTLPMVRYKTDDIGIVDGNYIYGLVGKNNHNIDMLGVNSMISSLNRRGSGIIDLKFRNNRFYITIIGDSVNNEIYNYFPHDNTTIITCGDGMCSTRVTHLKKVLVFSS